MPKGVRISRAGLFKGVQEALDEVDEAKAVLRKAQSRLSKLLAQVDTHLASHRRKKRRAAS